MIIINADDLGRSAAETNAAVELVARRRVTSVSAMVFMKDSERAATLASTMGVEVGLHLNFCESWSERNVPRPLAAEHEALVSFFHRSRYAPVVYNPLLRRSFSIVYNAQVEEFERLYGHPPSHVDGHRHRHLCANMLIDAPIPAGSRVRRNFTFGPGEKGLVNRAYRRVVDARLGRRYQLTDYFFSLADCLSGRGRPLSRIADLGRSSVVEIVTHPRNAAEFNFLAGDQFVKILECVTKGPAVKLATKMVKRAFTLATGLASLCQWAIP